MSTAIRAACYVRCSTDEQNVDMQLRDLAALRDQRGWLDAGVYSDEGESGAKESRPALDRMLDDARRGRFDVVCVWRFDRAARSTRHLIDLLDTLRGYGVQFVSLHESIDTSTPLGKAVYTIIAALAEMERSVIKERCSAGLARYAADYDAGRARPSRSGKNMPIGRPRRVWDRDEARAARERGESFRVIAARYGVGESTVRAALKGMEAR